MLVEKVVCGVPFYICETSAVRYRETWHRQLYNEIAVLFYGMQEKIHLRGSHTENLDKIAQTGSYGQHSGIGSLIYVIPYQHVVSIFYPFSRATTSMLIYKSSGLVECVGDSDNMGRNFNRYEFVVPPKEALLGIIDLREVTRISKRLQSLDRKTMRNMS